MFGLDAGTMIALAAMLITLFTAGIKYIDRRRNLKKERIETTKKEFNADVERDSIVVRGAEGALLLMEKTLKTANEECEKRINELEEENEALRCELGSLRTDLREVKEENNSLRIDLKELRQELNDLTNRVRKVE